MGQKWKAHSFGRKPFETLKHRVTGRLDTLSRNIVTSDPSPCRQGHFRSRKITNSFSAITFDRNQLEQWKHYRCVQDNLTDQMIWNMSFSDQVHWNLDMRSNFQNDFWGQITVRSTRLKKRNTMLAKCMPCLYSWWVNIFLAKNGYFRVFALWTPNYWS